MPKRRSERPMTRSEMMSRVPSSDTSLELVLRRALWTAGMRYRLHPKLPGRPDLVFVKSKVAIFVDGCFWHACPLHGRPPKSNMDYWMPKLARNRLRDLEVDSMLGNAGWQVMRIWEHDLAQRLPSIVEEVRLRIDSHPDRKEIRH